MTRKKDFPFLRREFAAVDSEAGRRHIWLWLTKRPDRMQEFAQTLGGLPENVCAMTTVTSTKQIGRVDQLRNVDASVRGLSLEPLWSSVAGGLDLTGIDWVIVGGESGTKHLVRPFEVEWAIELHELCKERGVAFFCKQLGGHPTYKGRKLTLKNRHGGEWSEWPQRPSGLRTREFPSYFHKYR